MSGWTVTQPRVLLRLEGAAVLAAALVWYWALQGSWGLFALLLLAPDLALLGFLAGPRAGAAAYNVVHTYVLPLLLAAGATVTGHRAAGLVALIWLAHLGADRLLGFGLKYGRDRKTTHLHKV